MLRYCARLRDGDDEHETKISVTDIRDAVGSEWAEACCERLLMPDARLARMAFRLGAADALLGVLRKHYAHSGAVKAAGWSLAELCWPKMAGPVLEDHINFLCKADAGKTAVEMLGRHVATADVCSALCLLVECLASVPKHRSPLMRAGAGDALVKVLNRHPGDPVVLGFCCAALQELAELEMAATQLQRAGADKALVAALKRSKDDANACAAICGAVAAIARTRKCRRAFDFEGAAAPIALAVKRHSASAAVCSAGCAALHAIGSDERTVVSVVSAGAAAAAVAALQCHAHDEEVCEPAVKLLHQVAETHLDCAQLADLLAACCCTKALQWHCDNPDVAESALRCVHELFRAAGDSSALRRRIRIATEFDDGHEKIIAALREYEQSASAYEAGAVVLERLADVPESCTTLQRAGAVEAAVVVLQKARLWKGAVTAACCLIARIAACGEDRIVVRGSGLAETAAAALSQFPSDPTLLSAACRSVRLIASKCTEDAVWLLRGGLAAALGKAIDSCSTDDAAAGAAADAIVALACTKANRAQLLEEGVAVGLVAAITRNGASSRCVERCCTALGALAASGTFREYSALSAIGADDALEEAASRRGVSREVRAAATAALERLRTARYT